MNNQKSVWGVEKTRVVFCVCPHLTCLHMVFTVSSPVHHDHMTTRTLLGLRGRLRGINQGNWRPLEGPAKDKCYICV